MNISAIITKMVKKTNKNEKILEKNLSEFSKPLFDLIPETIGIKAAFMAPSPKILLKRLGSLKATKKQSEIMLAPTTLAINKSLKYPSILLRKVSEPTIETILYNII
tara:strand:+ start:172 stop:492 length:321 start_codon:yes stop_codon:yes gene_type:complete